MQGTEFSRGKYRVTRLCCTSGMCLECGACGDRSKRKRVVQTDRVSEEWAQYVVDGWKGWDPEIEIMCDAP